MKFMQKTIYNEMSIYTRTGSQSVPSRNLADETVEALRLIFRRYVDEGYNFREVAHVMQGAIFDMETEEALRPERQVGQNVEHQQAHLPSIVDNNDPKRTSPTLRLPHIFGRKVFG